MIIHKKFYYFNNIENHLEYFKYLVKIIVKIE